MSKEDEKKTNEKLNKDVERAAASSTAKAAAKDAPANSPKVAEGHAVTSRRGVLGPGAVVTPADFSATEAEGKKRIDAFLKSGHLTKG